MYASLLAATLSILLLKLFYCVFLASRTLLSAICLFRSGLFQVIGPISERQSAMQSVARQRRPLCATKRRESYRESHSLDAPQVTQYTEEPPNPGGKVIVDVLASRVPRQGLCRDKCKVFAVSSITT